MKYDHLLFIIQPIELIYRAAQMDKVRFKQLVFKGTKFICLLMLKSVYTSHLYRNSLDH